MSPWAPLGLPARRAAGQQRRVVRAASPPRSAPRPAPAAVAEDGDERLAEAPTAEAVDDEVGGGVEDDEQVTDALVVEVGTRTREVGLGNRIEHIYGSRDSDT